MAQNVIHHSLNTQRWRTLYAMMQHWLQGYDRTVQEWLAYRPAGVMFPIGLVLGGGCGTLALLGIGGWPGMVVCLLLLGAAVPLVRGAEPVTREVPWPLDGVRPDTQAQPTGLAVEPSLPPEPTSDVVEDIPGFLHMVELPGGRFLMGSEADDAQAYAPEKPQHAVTVSGFAMGRYPVTRRLYQAVMEDHSGRWENDPDDDLLPANDVSWFDAVAFCNMLSERQRLAPCYRIDGNSVSWDRDVDGYRLPTEAELEYATRAGTTTRWFCGDAPTELVQYAWFAENSENRLHPVGEKAPNPWGLYDMAGNMYEWCWDWCSDYSVAAVTDPPGPDSGVFHVRRGGAYWVEARNLRSADRYRFEPVSRSDSIGFRVVRRPRSQP
jgi:formylglycine-generating enzyme required for sulfatase activity